MMSSLKFLHVRIKQYLRRTNSNIHFKIINWSEVGAEFKIHADIRLPATQEFGKDSLLVPVLFTLLFSLPLLIN